MLRLHHVNTIHQTPTGLSRIKCREGQIQLVQGRDHILLDVQGRERGVDGVARWNHGALLMTSDEIAQLHSALAVFLAPAQMQEAA